MPKVKVDKVEQLEDADLADLCDAAEIAILDGGGFGWLMPPRRDVMERRSIPYWPASRMALTRISCTVSRCVAARRRL